MVIKLDVKTIFTESTMPPALTKILVTRMLTRDLFAVANFLVARTERMFAARIVRTNSKLHFITTS